MVRLSVDEIQDDVPSFIARITVGEPLIIVRDDQPVAEVRPLPAVPTGKRPFGLAAGEFIVPDGFDEPLPEDVLKLFEGA